jgi:hypothetical protein
VLSKAKLAARLGHALPPWSEGLAGYLAELRAGPGPGK